MRSDQGSDGISKFGLTHHSSAKLRQFPSLHDGKNKMGKRMAWPCEGEEGLAAVS